MSGLYIHIPFCSVKCHFCDFTAFSGQDRAIPRYLAALAREAELRDASPTRSRGGARVGAFSTLYIGGGTPSELEKDDLKQLLGWIQGTWGPGKAFSESTFEANPESLSEEKLALLRDWGLTRISIGLQAAQEHLLKGLGRQHDLKQFLAVYALARKYVPEVNVDLMFGLPGQTVADWKETLDLVVGLKPEHISLYGLRVEDRTVFSKKGVIADEDLGADMYEIAVDTLTAAGFKHYEISNFAKPGHESRHNLGYWRDEEYLGLGCGATSFIGGVRKTAEPSIPAYCAAVERGVPSFTSEEKLAGKERLGEKVLLGLRQVDGLDLSDDMILDFGPSFRKLQEQGLLELAGSKARLTRQGLLLSNRAFQEFVGPFD